jgi:hypothetical protein
MAHIQKIDTIIIDEFTNLDVNRAKMTDWIVECLELIDSEIDKSVDIQKALSITEFKDGVDFKARFDFICAAFLKYVKNKWGDDVVKSLNERSGTYDDFYAKLKIKYNEDIHKIEYNGKNPIEVIAFDNSYMSE